MQISEMLVAVSRATARVNQEAAAFRDVEAALKEAHKVESLLSMKAGAEAALEAVRKNVAQVQREYEELKEKQEAENKALANSIAANQSKLSEVVSALEEKREVQSRLESWILDLGKKREELQKGVVALQEQKDRAQADLSQVLAQLRQIKDLLPGGENGE